MERVVEGWTIRVRADDCVVIAENSDPDAALGSAGIDGEVLWFGSIQDDDGNDLDLPLPVLRAMLEMWDARDGKDGG